MRISAVDYLLIASLGVDVRRSRRRAHQRGSGQVAAMVVIAAPNSGTDDLRRFDHRGSWHRLRAADARSDAAWVAAQATSRACRRARCPSRTRRSSGRSRTCRNARRSRSTTGSTSSACATRRRRAADNPRRRGSRRRRGTDRGRADRGRIPRTGRGHRSRTCRSRSDRARARARRRGPARGDSRLACARLPHKAVMPNRKSDRRRHTRESRRWRRRGCRSSTRR